MAHRERKAVARLPRRLVERHFLESLSRATPAQGEDSPAQALRYSPGYCGWHVSGQRALFAALRPAEIGLALRESCLMDPLKSISGVLVSGAPRIHDFVDDYPFCAECAERACRDRIASLNPL